MKLWKEALRSGVEASYRLLLAVFLVAVALWFLAESQPERPAIGETSADIRARFGEPGVIDKPGDVRGVYGEPWFESGKSERLTPAQLPPVTGERWFYATGLMGTEHFLIYFEDGSVDRVF